MYPTIEASNFVQNLHSIQNKNKIPKCSKLPCFTVQKLPKKPIINLQLQSDQRQSDLQIIQKYASNYQRQCKFVQEVQGSNAIWGNGFQLD